MKRIITLLSALAAALLLAVSAFAATLPGTAKCTITPSDTRVSGNTATVTYTITVTPPQGQQLGVFSVQLQPSQGLTLATNFYADGQAVITYGDSKLDYDEVSETGIFATYGYTPQTGYFAAVGTTPDRRMSDEATILTIQATMPADKAGTYTLNAEFIAALDGSGDVYTAQVITTPVTISAPGQTPTVDNTPVITETNADTPASGSKDSTGAAAGSPPTSTPGDTAPTGGSTTDPTTGNTTVDPTGNTPAAADTPADGSTPTDAAPADTGATDTDTASVPWLLPAILLPLAALACALLLKKKK